MYYKCIINLLGTTFVLRSLQPTKTKTLNATCIIIKYKFIN